jgi:hypothetical protein
MTSYQHENQEEYAFRLSESVSWASTIAKRATRLSAVLLMGCLPMNAQTGSSSAAPKPSEQKTQQQWLDSFSHLPMSFEANRGQTDPQVAFVSRGSGYTLFLTKDEAVFALNRSEGAQRRTSTLRMHFEGTNPKARVSGHDELEGKSNYFIGNDPNQWHTTIPTFARVENRGIYTGVDLVYYGNQQQLEYDLRVAPGADPGQIAFDFRTDHPAHARQGTTSALRVDADSNLVSSSSGSEVLLRRPDVYQLLARESGATEKKVVEAKYIVKKDNQVGFELGSYDHTKTLIIDPVVPFYSTYLGGAANDYGYGIALDAKGNAYVTGSTASLNFPVVACFQCANAGGLADAFVTELNPGGLVYSTYLGGAANDYGFGIAVDGLGNAYVTGSTNSPNFPVALCFQCVFQGGAADAFVTEIAAGGAGLIYSTYLGGKAGDWGRAIALDPAGDAFVTGNTTSKNFPVPGCVFGCVPGGLSDAFVTELKRVPGGPVVLVYSDYLGGKSNDYGYGIAVDPNQNAYVTGATSSPNFPITAPACFQCAPQGLSDAFVTHVAPFGAALVNSTYLGGPTNDFGYGIAIDGQRTVYVTGSTAGPFPLGPCFQCVYGGGVSDAFVTKLDPTLTGIIYSTYLGGAGADAGRGIAVDAMGDADVTGNTNSKNFPVANCFQCILNGGTDAFVTSLTPAGVAVIYSTYLGGRGNDFGRGIAVNLAFNPTVHFVTGYTNSVNYPVIGGGFPPAGLNDAFVTGLP